AFQPFSLRFRLWTDFMCKPCQTSSAQCQHLRAVDRVTGVPEITNTEKLVSLPFQEDEVDRAARFLAGIAYEDGRTALDETGPELPVVRLSVVVQIAAH